MLETEISSHEAIVQKLLQKLGQVLDESYFKEEIVVSGNTLKLEWQSLKEMSAARSRKIRESVFFHKVRNSHFMCHIKGLKAGKQNDMVINLLIILQKSLDQTFLCICKDLKHFWMYTTAIEL